MVKSNIALLGKDQMIDSFFFFFFKECISRQAKRAKSSMNRKIIMNTFRKNTLQFIQK